MNTTYLFLEEHKKEILEGIRSQGGPFFCEHHIIYSLKSTKKKFWKVLDHKAVPFSVNTTYLFLEEHKKEILEGIRSQGGPFFCEHHIIYSLKSTKKKFWKVLDHKAVPFSVNTTLFIPWRAQKRNFGRY